MFRSKKFSFGACRIAPQAARSLYQVRRSIKQPDGGLAVTGDDNFHECSKGLSLSVIGRQFLSPDSSTIPVLRRQYILREDDVSYLHFSTVLATDRSGRFRGNSQHLARAPKMTRMTQLRHSIERVGRERGGASLTGSAVR